MARPSGAAYRADPPCSTPPGIQTRTSTSSLIPPSLGVLSLMSSWNWVVQLCALYTQVQKLVPTLPSLHQPPPYGLPDRSGLHFWLQKSKHCRCPGPDRTRSNGLLLSSLPGNPSYPANTQFTADERHGYGNRRPTHLHIPAGSSLRSRILGTRTPHRHGELTEHRKNRARGWPTRSLGAPFILPQPVLRPITTIPNVAGTPPLPHQVRNLLVKHRLPERRRKNDQQPKRHIPHAKIWSQQEIPDIYSDVSSSIRTNPEETFVTVDICHLLDKEGATQENTGLLEDFLNGAATQTDLINYMAVRDDSMENKMLEMEGRIITTIMRARNPTPPKRDNCGPPTA